MKKGEGERVRGVPDLKFSSTENQSLEKSNAIIKTNDIQYKSSKSRKLPIVWTDQSDFQNRISKLKKILSRVEIVLIAESNLVVF